MTGRLIDLSIGLNHKQRVTVELDGDFREAYDRLKEDKLNIEIKKYRNRRSLSANAYFHVLVGKIAERQGLGNEEVKIRLVCEYGTLLRDSEDLLVGLKLSVAVEPSTVYPYTQYCETKEENGKLYNCYLMYKRTRYMDSAEMARLIDGAIFEAQELDIETDTPEQLAKYKEEWGRAD